VKLAVPALGRTTCSAVAPTFARCPYFIVIDTDCHDTLVVENGGQVRDSGAGTAAVQLLADMGVGLVLAQRCGPQATKALAAARIELRLGFCGTVVETIEAFTAGLPQ
jgi:predicted Fe-Mo cluster-binding NifX family protein